MAQGSQKADHGGQFLTVPRRVIDSEAWRELSMRAKAVLQVLHSRHNGFNNGFIAVGIHQIGKALGDQNHSGNSKAVAELIEKGFVECVADENRHQQRAREYRLTFISTGDGKTKRPATNEYLQWSPRPGITRKFGGARTATQTSNSVAETATKRKSSVVASATPPAGNTRFCSAPHVAVTTRHIVNHPANDVCGSEVQIKTNETVPISMRADDCRVGIDELRTWAKAVIDELGYGGARKLAKGSVVPESVLSRFRSGGRLPDSYRLGLQLACARVLPYHKLRDAAA